MSKRLVFELYEVAAHTMRQLLLRLPWRLPLPWWCIRENMLIFDLLCIQLKQYFL